MFKIFKDFWGDWVAVPYEGSGYFGLGMIVLGLIGVCFFSLAGIPFILLSLIVFLVLPALTKVCEKIKISTGWLCILQEIFSLLIIKVTDGAMENAGQDAWVLLIGLFMTLVCVVGSVIYTAGDNIFIFFLTIPILGICFLNFISEISFTTGFVICAIIIQVIIAAADQIRIRKNN